MGSENREKPGWNGDVLAEYVRRHAADWGLGAAFEAWLETAVVFVNTLVDRIVPGSPADEAPVLARELGYRDTMIVAGELFHLLVIEGDRRLAAGNIAVAPVSEGQAHRAFEAFLRYGKGRHPARLNLGDCFAYALAKERGEPLLFKGDDFARTDIEPAL